MNITALIAACTMASCVTLVVAEDGKRPSGNDGPLSRNTGSGGSSDNGSGPLGSRSHGLNGSRWQDRVPREPMWFINAGPGETNHSIHPEDNARGYAVWWRGERAVDELLIRIHKGYEVGARWFFINRPMGSTQAQTNLPGASWLTIKDQKRADLPEQLTRAMLDEFDEPVHIVWYVGSDISDPREYPGWTPETDEEFYLLGENDTYEELIGSRVTLGGWISTGASGLGLDSVSPVHQREHFIELFEQLNGSPFRLNIYGEAYPLIFDNRGLVRDQYNGPVLDQNAISRMPWMATSEFIDHRWPLGAASDVFPVNTDTTRMFIWLEKSSHRYGDASERVELINKYLDRGLIPITYDPVMFREAVQRVRPSYSSSSSSSSSGGSTPPPAGGGDETRTASTTSGGSGGGSSGGTTSGGSAGGSSGSQSGASATSGGAGAQRAARNNLPKRYQRRSSNP